MTARKLLKVLVYLAANDIKLNGVWVGSSYGGELVVSLSGQPSEKVDKWMRHNGFITNEESQYIYRP